MKVCDAASSHPRPHPGQRQVLKPRLHVPRLVMASVRVCLAAQVHTGGLEGVSAKYLLTQWDPGQEGSPGRNRIFMVTQGRVRVMSCNTVNVPCFLGLFGQIPRHHLMRPGIGFRLITTSLFGSGARVS